MKAEYLVDPDSGQTVLTRGSESIVAPKPFSDLMLDHNGTTEGTTLDIPDDAWEELKEMIKEAI